MCGSLSGKSRICSMLAKRSEGLQVSDMPALEGPVNPKLDFRPF